MDDEMLKDFVVEALDLATNVEEHLLTLERHPDDLEILNAVFRAFHTIKGGAGFVNLPAMVSACHLTENLFDALRTGKAPVTPLAIEAALQASGFVADQLTELSNGAAPDSLASMPAELKDILTQAIEGKSESAPAPAAAAPAPAAAAPVAAPAAAAPVATASVDGSASVMKNGELDWPALYQAVVPGAAAAPVAEGSAEAAPVAAAAAAPVAAAAAAPAADGEPKAAAPAQQNRRATDSPGGAKEESIRIDAVKLDALLEVAGESVQAANQAAVLLEKLQQFKFEGTAAALMSTLAETLGRASRYSSELQRATLSTRMQPVGRLFQKFPRLVRELAKDLGKDVDLVITGAETEVDRVVVDSLYDPLVHMLRNSLDHGIEVDRAAAGKPNKATISLNAWQAGSSVMIEVFDDGKGMDPDMLRNKALAKGLINEHQALTSDEALQLVFLPGFSTKEVASSVSGRGVGMDVVKTAVEKHRGTIRIESTIGKGTKFSIRLPIELSIIPTMLVRCAGAPLALPMAVVERVVELPETFDEVGGAPVLRDQGRPLPVNSLAGVLGYEPGNERVGIVMAVPHPYILGVESVEGTADLVIKPLTAIHTAGITGTARSAEGELVLVVGLSFLLDGCRDLERTAVA
ncbi:chemotaxis protein CheA [Herbaspirillum sp.]|uniref:chemotaxis protein CheA n=1 Tax=Herbaspirillum TaxID=963 RepID=UPI002587A8FB|nr:chemotaxis protein CheA [Herbaspirillum sp.]MCP3656483.1 chemotaxis protein CheA [Herbaspirillum sp.]MCP3948499.1 chemotaxis protein CheA [Herbaspirillum sp.]MCP4031580.1 chemotaxis protein CheA [Herbaspirillum sp.]MCP4557978.1 chemotaxis protein CheA [Herbaspirillum sp.]